MRSAVFIVRTEDGMRIAVGIEDLIDMLGDVTVSGHEREIYENGYSYMEEGPHILEIKRVPDEDIEKIKGKK